MIVGKRVPVPATTRVVTTTFCDLCEKEIVERNGHQRDEVEIEHSVGNVWPEADCRQVTWVDVCTSCFQERVRPAIEALGAKFRTRSGSDYHYVDKGDEADW